MMVICKSCPAIDIKEAVGVYEFSVVPRSMFAADGKMLHCSAKSALMSILEKFPNDRSVEQAEPTNQFANADVQIKVSIVDGMDEVQPLKKPGLDQCRQKRARNHYFMMQIMTAEITTLRTLCVHVVSNSVMFPQILYDFVLYARHFLPVKVFPEYYFYKQCFELPQHVTWTDE